MGERTDRYPDLIDNEHLDVARYLSIVPRQPILWYERVDPYPIRGVTFEINNYRHANDGITPDEPVVQRFAATYPTWIVDYRNPVGRRGLSVNERSHDAELIAILSNSTAAAYSRSRDYVQEASRLDPPPHLHRTIDLDWVWSSNTAQCFACEVTTFFVRFSDDETVSRLLGKWVDAQASRVGRGSPHQFVVQATACAEAGLEFRMLFVNTVSKTDHRVLLDGNAVWFRVDQELAVRLHAGNTPQHWTRQPLRQFCDD